MKRSRIFFSSFFDLFIDDYGFNLSFVSYLGEGKISEKLFLSLGKLIVLSKIEELDFLMVLLALVLELYLENN